MTQLRLREDALAWREINGELVAVDVDSSTYLAANAAGMLLWRMLATGATLEQLADALVDRFGIDLDRALTDASSFVGSLAARGLFGA